MYRSKGLPRRDGVHSAVDHASPIVILKLADRSNRFCTANAVDARGWFSSYANQIALGVLLVPDDVYEKLDQVNVVRAVRAALPYSIIDGVEYAKRTWFRHYPHVCH